MFDFLPSVWWVFALVFWEGLLGGLVSSHRLVRYPKPASFTLSASMWLAEVHVMRTRFVDWHRNDGLELMRRRIHRSRTPALRPPGPIEEYCLVKPLDSLSRQPANPLTSSLFIHRVSHLSLCITNLQSLLQCRHLQRLPRRPHIVKVRKSRSRLQLIQSTLPKCKEVFSTGSSKETGMARS